MRNGGIQIRVSDVLFILKKRWKTIAALTLLGLMFGFLLSGMTYVQNSLQTYEFTGSWAITTRNSENRYINGSLAATNNDYHLAEDMVDAVRYIILSDKVMSDVIAEAQLSGVTLESLVVAERVARAVKISAEKGILDLKDFPLLMHIDEILTQGREVNIPWEDFVWRSF